MPHTQPTTASSSFQSIFNSALKTYEKRTKKNLLTHPLATQFENCDSTTAILSVLQDQVQKIDQHRSSNEKLTKWLVPTVNVLYAFSATLGEGLGLVNLSWSVLFMICGLICIFQVFSPAKVIFAGFGVLLLVGMLLHIPLGGPL